jgi:hypothetical protein
MNLHRISWTHRKISHLAEMAKFFQRLNPVLFAFFGLARLSGPSLSFKHRHDLVADPFESSHLQWWIYWSFRYQ